MGKKGTVKGDLASEIKITPPDFTKSDVLSKRTDGELFSIIGQGSEVMPAQRGRLRDIQRWEIVAFLRGLEGKTPAKATAEQKEQLENIRVIQQ